GTAGDIGEGGVGVGEWLGGRPDQLRGIHFHRGENSDHQAGEYGRQQNIPPRVFGFLRQRGNPVETDVGKYGDRGGGENGFGIPTLRIVKRTGEKRDAVVGISENVPSGSDEEDRDHHPHGHGQASVHSRSGFDA